MHIAPMHSYMYAWTQASSEYRLKNSVKYLWGLCIIFYRLHPNTTQDDLSPRETHTHTQLYQQSPVCTICSNKRQWAFSKLHRLQSVKVTTRGFKNLSTAHWLLKCCIQKKHVWLVSIGWVARGGPPHRGGVKRWMLRGRGKRSIYKWNLK